MKRFEVYGAAKSLESFSIRNNLDQNWLVTCDSVGGREETSVA